MNLELLKSLCSSYGPTSAEDGIRELILQEAKAYADDWEVDALGNLIVHKKGSGKKMMLAGHMDQIGMLITDVGKEGFLSFTNLGGLSPHNCLTQRVKFKNGVIGVVGCTRLDDMKDVKMDKLYIDIGARSQEDALQHVKVGDICVYMAEPLIDDYKIVSPALDDRIGCFIMLEALKQIKSPAFDIYFAFTVQEEVGLRGAKTSAYAIDPDYGIAFDVTLSYDIPGSKKLPSKMGKGAAIKLKDSSVICHPSIVAHMESCAKAGNIPYQFEILEAGGTDSGAIHISRNGVPSGVISVATRYIHSASEMCSISDIESAVALTVNVLETEIK